MKILYFDCPAGISGDMTLGALLDSGVSEEALRSQLSALGVDDEFDLVVTPAQKLGIVGTKVNVHLHNQKHPSHEHIHEQAAHIHEHIHDHEHEHSHEHEHEHVHTEPVHHHTGQRNLTDITAIINRSSLSDSVKNQAIAMFTRLAEAEGKVHGKPVEEVHFHEVGAIDSIVDMVGVCICLNELKVDQIIFSPINTGSGTVKCQHGIMPVPAPATAELLTGLVAYSNGTNSELTTPTGALIVRQFAEKQGPVPVMKVLKTGYGMGNKDFEFANCLRVILGETQENAQDEVTQLECNIDDMSGEIAGYVLGKLLDAGALDAWLEPIYMKKNRPAYKLCVLCREENRAALETILLQETTTLGVRRHICERTTLERWHTTVQTEFGMIDVKAARTADGVKCSPEYESCAAAASKFGIPLTRVYAAVLAALETDHK